MLATAASLLVLNAAAAPPGNPMTSPSQLLVLGMHHSGTSVVSNLTMMMGAFGGKHEELLLHPDNPLKFWECRDVVALDEQRLVSGIQEVVSSRYEVPEWVAYGFDSAKAATRVHETAEAKAIVHKLNAQRPWVTKDPRMCLLADEWMPLLDAPMCIIVHREPLSVANSMMIYSHNVSLAEWASVYETYYTNAMRACDGKPTVVVQHAELVANPYSAVKKLYASLVAAGVHGLTLPTEAQVARLIRPSVAATPLYLLAERQIVGQRAHAISSALSFTTGAPLVKPAAATWHVSPRREHEAIATLLTTDNADYLRGALVLGSSIRSFDSSRDMVCLVTPSVPTEWKGALEVAGWKIVEVPELEEFWWGQSEECSAGSTDQGERWGHMATKLRLWQLTQYQRVLYLDADTILTGPVSDVFGSVSTFAAEAPKYHSHFNAGVMLLTPSLRVFDELLILGKQNHASVFGNLIDCTEQGLLNTYYDGTAGREVTKLPIGRADVKADWSSTAAPWAVHWITHVCPKPWRIADAAEPLESHCDASVYSYWQRVWDRLTHSSKDASSAINHGARESARRKMRRLTGVSAGPSLVGRQLRAAPPASIGELWSEVGDTIGRQLRSVMNRRELRRRRRRREEYDSSPVMTPEAWAWVAIIGTLALGLAAGALLHKLFIKAPTEVGKGMTVVQAKRMGFMAIDEKGQQGVVSAVDDDDDDDDEDEDEDDEPELPKKGKK